MTVFGELNQNTPKGARMEKRDQMTTCSGPGGIIKTPHVKSLKSL
jgi:hypothetical protein